MLSLLATQISFAGFIKGPSLVKSFSTPFDYGSESYEDAVIDQDGTAYVVGDTRGPLNEDYSSSFSKYYIHCYKEGTIVWQAAFMDKAMDFYADEIISLDAQTLLVIYTQNNADNNAEVIMAKISKSNGSILGSKVLYTGHPYSNYTSGYSVLSNNTGGFLLIDADNRLYSYESDWSVQWQMDFPLGNYNFRSQLAFDAKGNLIVGGAADFAGTGRSLPSIAYYNSQGVQIWQKYFPDNSAEAFRGVCADVSGAIYAFNRISGGLSVRKLNSFDGSETWRQIYAIDLETWLRPQVVLGKLLFVADSYTDGFVFLNLDNGGLFNAIAPLGLQLSNSFTDDVEVSPNGRAVVVGANGGDAFIETFAFLPKIEPDRQNPTLVVTDPRRGELSTTRSRVTVSVSASDNLSPTHVLYRMRSPGRPYGPWRSAALKGESKTKSWKLVVATPKRGLWQVEFRSRDAAGNLSAVRRASITRR